MQLMRRLADQGRTIVLITHATKNVVLADKVVFLARGGHLVWFGAPEEALEYFNQFRSERDQRARPMEFDEIYALLDDPSKGSPEQWAERYQKHSAYRDYIVDPLSDRVRDGLAVGLPLGDAPAFFCMGQLDHYINIWHWKADWQSDVDRRAARAQERKGRRGVRRFEVIPRRASSVEDLIGGGFSTLTSKRTQGRIQGQARWNRGVWQVVMTRPLGGENQENEARLDPGRLQAIAFAVWNGENRERNGQKAVAPWFQLAIDPVGKT